MVNVKVLLIALFVLPAVILAGSGSSSSKCSVSVTSSQTASGRYNTYTALATNTGSSTVTNIVLTASGTLKTLDGLTQSGSGYSISTLAAGATKSFTFTVKSGNNIKWTTKCSSSSATSSPTTAPVTSSPTKTPVTSAPTKSPVTTSPTKTPVTTSPTTAPTKATTKPSTNGKLCPTGSWWAPAPLTTWQWQLTGTIDTSLKVQMYDIDLFDATSSLISTLHSQGKAVICYFSTQYEDWRPDASSFPASVKGKALDDWAGENYVDIRSSALRAVMTARLDLAVSKGCDGVEPDNVDGYTASSGFPLTAADQINFNTFIANEAHSRSLSVGLKNDLDQAKALQPVFDWALNEQCYQYKECTNLNAFVSAGKAVFNTEYSGSGSTVCPYMNNLKFSSLIKDLSLGAAIKAQCCTYLNPSCAAAAYTCKSSSSARDVRSVEAVEEIEQQEVAPELSTQEFTASASTTTFASVFLVAVVLAALNF